MSVAPVRVDLGTFEWIMLPPLESDSFELELSRHIKDMPAELRKDLLAFVSNGLVEDQMLSSDRREHLVHFMTKLKRNSLG